MFKPASVRVALPLSLCLFFQRSFFRLAPTCMYLITKAFLRGRASPDDCCDYDPLAARQALRDNTTFVLLACLRCGFWIFVLVLEEIFLWPRPCTSATLLSC